MPNNGENCSACKGTGKIWLEMTNEWGCCFECNETGIATTSEMSAEEAEMPPDEERQAIEILDALGDEISAKAVWLAARDFYQPRVSEQSGTEVALRIENAHNAGFVEASKIYSKQVAEIEALWKANFSSRPEWNEGYHKALNDVLKIVKGEALDARGK